MVGERSGRPGGDPSADTRRFGIAHLRTGGPRRSPATAGRVGCARVAVCYWWAGYGEPLEPAVALRALPPAAQEILRGEVREFDAAWTTIRAVGVDGPYECSEIPFEEVRVVDALLKESGAEPLPEGSPSSGGYVAAAGGTICEMMVTFEPILPHGEWSTMGG